MTVIDAHIHYVGDHPDALRTLRSLELKLLNVAVAHDASGQWRLNAGTYRELAHLYPERYAWCTTFDPPDFARIETYADDVIAGLQRDFDAGAVACKIWKNVGMRLRKPSGAFLMVDDPLFDPLYEYLASVGKSVLMHIGEPLGCWQPLDARNTHAGYYRAHPEWYMGDKPDHPSHKQLIEARDGVLARHPNLRVVGAHLGSLEYDVAEIARRFDRFGNFAVDTSARLRDLVRQKRSTVREFFVRHQERILFGTDVVQRQPVSEMNEQERSTHLASLEARYRREFAYFRSSTKMMLDGLEVQGLALPMDVIDQLLYRNAVRWYPGL